jgi:hypothetical protein
MASDQSNKLSAMSQKIGRQTPEDRELKKKRSELAALEADLAQRELDLATLRSELRTFEGRYFRAVGALFAELDEVHARLAEAQARQHPRDPKLRHEAAEARAQATSSAETVGSIVQRKQQADFAPSEDLKKLYREIARLVHPDLTTDERERTRRTRMMAEANRAYEEGDETKLRAILDEWVSSPDSVQGDGIAAELVRTIRQIHQVESRLAEIELETAGLKSSDLFILQLEVKAANDQHRDLFEEMADDVKRQVASARTTLATLSSVI